MRGIVFARRYTDFSCFNRLINKAELCGYCPRSRLCPFSYVTRQQDNIFHSAPVSPRISVVHVAASLHRFWDKDGYPLHLHKRSDVLRCIRPVLCGLPPSFHLYAGHGYAGLAQPFTTQAPQTATSGERFRHVTGSRLSH